MKRILAIIIAVASAAVAMSGCNADRQYYSGPEYVMFADTMGSYAVTVDDNDLYDVMIASTVARDYDRHYAVEIVDEGSTAIEGKHYRLLDNNFTIKAGERSAKVQIQGIYDNIVRSDSIGVKLRLVIPEELKWDLYGDITKVDFMKSCPFDIDDFSEVGDLAAGAKEEHAGYYLFYATFPYNKVNISLVKSQKLDDRRVKIFGPFVEGMDMVVSFDASDPFSPTVEINSQDILFASDAGNVTFRTSTNYPSYFYTCDGFIQLYLEAYIDNYMNLGINQYLLQKISPEQAKEYLIWGPPSGSIF